MRARSFVLPGLAAIVVLCGPLLGYAVGARPRAGGTSRSHHVYRLDYIVSVTEAGKAAATSKYTMNVEENEQGELRAGANVPLSSSSSGSPRQDVGLLLRCRLARAGEELVLHQTTELSGTDDRADQGPRTIRKITMNDDAVATLGTPAVVGSVEEPATRARYEVTVTATKLR
ncbi:MAG TPA: hypothetical protein VIF09_16175 [Polyangiaceae bacterium]